MQVPAQALRAPGFCESPHEKTAIPSSVMSRLGTGFQMHVVVAQPLAPSLTLAAPTKHSKSLLGPDLGVLTTRSTTLRQEA